jgi:hypothetical protein
MPPTERTAPTAGPGRDADRAHDGPWERRCRQTRGAATAAWGDTDRGTELSVVPRRGGGRRGRSAPPSPSPRCRCRRSDGRPSGRAAEVSVAIWACPALVQLGWDVVGDDLPTTNRSRRSVYAMTDGGPTPRPRRRRASTPWCTVDREQNCSKIGSHLPAGTLDFALKNRYARGIPDANQGKGRERPKRDPARPPRPRSIPFRDHSSGSLI